MHLTSVTLYVENGTVPDVLAFYGRAFGCATRYYDADFQYGELTTGGATVAVAAHAAAERMMPGGYVRPPRGTAVGGVEIAFTVADVAGAFERAVGAGAGVVAAPSTLPWGQEAAYVRGVEGTLVGLIAPMPSPQEGAP